MIMGEKIKVKRTKFNNALIYKLPNRHFLIIKEEEKSLFLIVIKKLLILNDKEKKEIKKLDSDTTFLLQRKHSKYCIWKSEMNLSIFELSCLRDGLKNLYELKP